MKLKEQLLNRKASGRREFIAGSCCLGSTLGVFFAGPSGQELPASLMTTEDRIAFALMRFEMGFHCSQCVLEAYAEDFGIEPELGRRLSAGLAGGSTVGGECGAVGSAYLVLGLRYGKSLPSHGNEAREPELWNRIRRFVAEFRRRHGAIDCRDLLGVDVFTSEGREEALRRNLFAERCPNYIRDSITIIDSL
jgi:C_GCAxxG_C_C family probable redox protein